MTSRYGFEFLPHTADIKFLARGRNPGDAFAFAAAALAATICDPGTVPRDETRRISISAEDEKALLYDFLEQIIILLDSERFVISAVESLVLPPGNENDAGPFSLDATISGSRRIDSFEVHRVPKAVTYQGMQIERTEDGCEICVVVDI